MSASRFKPYPAYKDSGVEWLGEIPTPWNVKRLRFVSESNPVPSEVRGLPGETEVSFVPMEAIGEQGGLSVELTKQLADVKAGYTYFREGDIVIVGGPGDACDHRRQDVRRAHHVSPRRELRGGARVLSA